MGIFSNLLDFITSFDDSSYIEDSKVWGDEVWNSIKGVSSGTLSLIMFDERCINSWDLPFVMVIMA